MVPEGKGAIELDKQSRTEMATRGCLHTKNVGFQGRIQGISKKGSMHKVIGVSFAGFISYLLNSI